MSYAVPVVLTTPSAVYPRIRNPDYFFCLCAAFKQKIFCGLSFTQAHPLMRRHNEIVMQRDCMTSDAA